MAHGTLRLLAGGLSAKYSAFTGEPIILRPQRK